MSELSLTWDDHHNTLVGVFETLLETSTLVDCTLAAEGQYLKAHKIILSACSPYFELLFKQENEKNPIVVLKDIKFQELKAMIDFIYRGKVKVPEERLGDFVDAAESLQIKGLGGDNSKSPKHTKTENTVAQSQVSRKSPPPRKRRRRSYVSDSEDDGGTSSPAPEIGYEKTVLSGHPTSFLKVDSLKCSQNNLSATSVGVVDNLVSATSSGARSEPNMDKSESVYFSNSTITSSNKLAQPETVVKREPEPVEPNDLFEPEMEFIETKEESITENTILDSEEDTSEPTEPLNVNELSRSQFPTFPTNLQSTAGAESIFPPLVMPEVNRNQGGVPASGEDPEVSEDVLRLSGAPLPLEHASAAPAASAPSPAAAQMVKIEMDASPPAPEPAAAAAAAAFLPKYNPFAAAFAVAGPSTAGPAGLDCPVCRRSFYTPASLDVHLRKHAARGTGRRRRLRGGGAGVRTAPAPDGAPAFKCDLCERTFYRENELAVHRRLHTGEKLYQCDKCDVASAYSSDLLRHKRVMHSWPPSRRRSGPRGARRGV